MAYIQHAFDYCTKKLPRSKQRRQASKLQEIDEQQARKHIVNDLIKLYSKEELGAMEHVELNRMDGHATLPRYVKADDRGDRHRLT